jgi:signal transduction histidine kinase
MSRAFQSIRFKLALLAGGAVLVAGLCAIGLVLGARASDLALERAITAQRRLDLLTGLSARFSDYGLVAVDSANGAPDATGRLTNARARIDAALARVSAALEANTAGDQDPGDTTASHSRAFAHLNADFRLLHAQIEQALAENDEARRADITRGALNAFAAGAGPVLSLLVEAEQQATAAARENARRLSHDMQWAAIGAALALLAAIALLHRRITGPLVARIGAIEQAAIAIGRGELDIRLDPGARDELGLLVTRFNRMAVRLARRESRLSQGRAALERTVAERTADLTAANERLTAIDNSRRRFFADVSHELRTPLTVIIGECDLALRSAAEPDDPIRAALATIRGRALRLNRRVEDLLRVARSESGEIELQPREVALHPILEDAIESFARPAQRRGLRLQLEDRSLDIVVTADREWLRQVIEGLIDNALRHAAGATVVVLQAEEQDDGVIISIADDGCGIPPEVREKLLERFSRIPGSGETGFGIGLALARWVIEHHGGTIGINGNESAGRGTRILITLPRTARRI